MNKLSSYQGSSLNFSSKSYSSRDPVGIQYLSESNLKSLNGIPESQTVEKVYRKGRLNNAPNTENHPFMVLKVGNTYYDGSAHHIAAPVPPYNGHQ